jgi:hypothetical protein
VYFRIFVRFYFDFIRFFRSDFAYFFLLIFRLSVRFWSFFTQWHRHTIASHALVILQTRDDRSDLKQHSHRCLVYIQFRCNSETRGTNWNIAHHLPAAPKQAERIAFMASTIPIIYLRSRSSNIYHIWIDLDQTRSPPVGFHSKTSFKAL